MQSERESPLWNAVRGAVTELVTLCWKKPEGPEAAWKQSRKLFERFQFDSYDEIVFIDGNMVGPFYPLEEMFTQMSPDAEGMEEEGLSTAEKADFWGLIRNIPVYTPRKEKYPEYIDPRFLVLRRNVYDCLKSFSFYQRLYQTVSEAEERVLPIQIAFTHALEQSGCHGAVYCDMEAYRNSRSLQQFCLV